MVVGYVAVKRLHVLISSYEEATSNMLDKPETGRAPSQFDGATFLFGYDTSATR